MPNFRDAGGHTTAEGGRVRTGLLYRSDQISGLTGEDARVLAGLGVRAVYDLRTAVEREVLPGERIPGATHLSLDVMADDTQSAASQLIHLLVKPEAAGELLGGGKGVALLIDSYRSMVRLGSARAALGRFYADLADGTRLPALLHCTTGKDRTGWACAALLMFLGVPYPAVLDDFLASNRFVLPKYRPHLQAFAARGGDAELLTPVLSVREEYLAASLEEVRGQFGSIERYFAEGLGVGADARRALRERFVAGLQESSR
jgi:protein-tyrosine phosphatase